mmetsp:Transcript_99415/g.145390  ORF Transcript_99415/g.145390 Transcript_99415/m.145390 type:complete len:104 (-) Transcript_99415:119-430(-)
MSMCPRKGLVPWKPGRDAQRLRSDRSGGEQACVCSTTCCTTNYLRIVTTQNTCGTRSNSTCYRPKRHLESPRFNSLFHLPSPKGGSFQWLFFPPPLDVARLGL